MPETHHTTHDLTEPVDAAEDLLAVGQVSAPPPATAGGAGERDERVPTTSGRGILTSVVVALVVVVLGNAAANLYLDRWPVNTSLLSVSEAWDRVESTGPVDWVVVGDSSCAVGVDPAALADLLGGPVLNACTTGDFLTVDDAWMLQRYVERHGAPAGGVIVVHAYDVWDRGYAAFPVRTVTRIAAADDAAGRLAPVVDTASISSLTRFLDRNVPVWSETASLSTLVREPERLFDRATVSRGGFRPVTTRSTKGLEADIAVHLRIARSDADTGRPVTISGANVAGLVALADAVEGSGTPIVVVPAPVAAPLAADPVWRAREAAVRDAVDDLLATIPGVAPGPDTPSPAFPVEHMQSAEHVFGVEAVAAYTASVAERVAGTVRDR